MFGGFGGCDGPDVPELREVIPELIYQADRIQRTGLDAELRYDDLLSRNEEAVEDFVDTLNTEADRTSALGRDLQQRYVDTAIPLQDQFIAEAQGYDTATRRNRKAGRAIGEVTQAIQAQKDSLARQLEGFGVDPSQTRFAALDRQAMARDAAAKVAAAEEARQRVEDTGRTMRLQAIDMTRGDLEAGTGLTQIATGNRSRALSSLGSQLDKEATIRGTVPQLTQLEAGLRGQIANTEMARFQGKIASKGAKHSVIGDVVGGVGGLAGVAAGAYLGGPAGAAIGGQVGSSLGEQ